MTKTLLIDGDLFAYQTAAAEERAYEWEPGQWTYTADATQGAENLDAALDHFAEHLGASRVIVTISDRENWRKEVMPSYKSNRDGVRRPMLLPAMLDHLRENYEVFIRPRLEADDVMGILATNKKVIPGRKVIVTQDKDLRGVPGFHWNPVKEADRQEVQVTEAQADAFFYQQVLSGDPTDGYGGCPGIGSTRAARIVAEPVELIPEERQITRGVNAGTTRIVWNPHPTNDLWAAIVSHYVKAGLGEEDALLTARVARILRTEDYDYKNQKEILWTPR